VVSHEYGEPAYTLREAAELLGVSPQRINQMLSPDASPNGPILIGPNHDAKRASPNIARVWKRSLDVERQRRSHENRSLAGAPFEIDTRDEGSLRVLRAEAAVQRLKVALDCMRDEVRAERQRTREMTRKLVELNLLSAQALQRVVSDADSQAEVDDEVIGQYSDALTQLISADDIGQLEDGVDSRPAAPPRSGS
jgi:hypothetical protein